MRAFKLYIILLLFFPLLSCDLLTNLLESPDSTATHSTVTKPDSWELEVTTTSSSQNMTIQMDGSPVNPVNLRVDWGDGIEDTTILTSLTHTYASAGVYTMRIRGEASRIHFDNPDAQARLTRILSVVKGIYGITSFENTFHNCTNLTGEIPAGLFDNCPNVTTFKWVFRDCSGLTGSIPAGLFDKCPDALNFRSAFIRCSGLTGPIPAGLFDKNPNASDFLNTFQSCSGLTAIPDGLFNNNPNASNFMYTFQHCTGLTYVPSDLFDNTHNVITFQETFAHCTGITSSVPELWVDTAAKFPKLELPKFAAGCFSNVPNASNWSVIPSMWGGPGGSIENPGNSDNAKVKVFILAGQSNMVGAGTITPTAAQLDKNGGKGTLEYMAGNSSLSSTYGHLKTNSGNWVERDDVWIIYQDRSGPLSVGYGSDVNHIGPEMQFGHVLGDHYEAPVLIIKVAWGGKSLQTDFRPPSSGGQVGPYYTEMINRVHYILNNISKEMATYQGQGYEIIGIGWHQGWNDRINDAANDEYQFNCVNLINDLRNEFSIQNLPFVLATTGMSGWNETHPRALSLMEAQLAVPNDSRLKGGNAKAVETRGYWRDAADSPADQGYHWNRSAETYFLIGNGMGEAMVQLISN